MYQYSEGQVIQAYAVEEPSCPNPGEPVNETGLRNFLQANAWPSGLQDTLVKGARRIPIRYFVCDDSGSMAIADGMQIVKGSVDGQDRYMLRSKSFLGIKPDLISLLLI